MMMNWTAEILRDIRPFSDAAVQLSSELHGSEFRVKWKSRRKPFEATFIKDDQNAIFVLFEGVKNTYRSFLASPAMSDMLGLAGMISQVPAAAIYVDTRAVRNDDPDSEAPALSMLQQSVNPLNTDATNVLFITGDAGAGKTEVLKQLVRRQADLFLEGGTDYLFLYVNAQGRALARLDEALATEIQDLRATNLTYHAVPSLTRNGILVPLIDGFDELLGVLGYEDSFSSLRRFLDELNGRGCIIASARSTYYQQEFLSRTGRTNFPSQRISIDQISIQSWSDLEFKSYLDYRYIDEAHPSIDIAEFRSKISDIFRSSENSILKSKPFFVAKTADLVLSGREITGEELVDQLVYGYVERERTEKLLDRNGAPLLEHSQIENFVQSIGEEMWIMETRSLDGESVRILSDLFLSDESLSEEAGAVVRERASTMAFFALANGMNRIEFEHQLFHSYFLGRVISQSFEAGRDALFAEISRAAFPEYTATFAARRLAKNNHDLTAVTSMCASLSQLSSQRMSQTRENAGELVLSSVRSANDSTGGSDVHDIGFSKLIFAGSNFGQIRFENCSFNDVEFRRCDMSHTTFHSCSSSRMGLHEITIDPTKTRLDIRGIEADTDVYGLRVRNQNGITQVFRVDSIEDYLSQCGAPFTLEVASPSVSDKALDLLERTLRRYEKATLFWAADDGNKNIIIDPNWPTLERLLVECKIVTREHLAHQGVPRPALRRNFLPHQIMAGEVQSPHGTSEVRKFWAAMREEFPRN